MSQNKTKRDLSQESPDGVPVTNGGCRGAPVTSTAPGWDEPNHPELCDTWSMDSTFRGVWTSTLRFTVDVASPPSFTHEPPPRSSAPHRVKREHHGPRRGAVHEHQGLGRATQRVLNRGEARWPKRGGAPRSPDRPVDMVSPGGSNQGSPAK